jgi:phosphatidylglycerophosphatase A
VGLCYLRLIGTCRLSGAPVPLRLVKRLKSIKQFGANLHLRLWKNLSDERKEKLKRYSSIFLATGGYSGYFPVAPGTVGTVVGVGILWALSDAPQFFRFVLALFLSGAGVWAAYEVGRLFRQADSPKIVIDEIVGIMVTMIGIPITGYWLACGFVLFRFFDIAKLPPINWLDSRLKNGWGVMADDVMSGIYCNLILRLMLKTSI